MNIYCFVIPTRSHSSIYWSPKFQRLILWLPAPPSISENYPTMCSTVQQKRTPTILHKTGLAGWLGGGAMPIDSKFANSNISSNIKRGRGGRTKRMIRHMARYWLRLFYWHMQTFPDDNLWVEIKFLRTIVDSQSKAFKLKDGRRPARLLQLRKSSGMAGVGEGEWQWSLVRH